MDPKKTYILQLSTAPAVSYGATPGMPGFTTYRKKLIKTGHYDDTSGADFDVTGAVLDNWMETFTKMRNNGNRIPLSLSHDKADDPKADVGQCLSLFRDNGSLWGNLVIADENRALALSNDVSIYSPPEHTDDNGVKYMQPITHIALTANPAVSGLGAFVQLSLSKGDNEMDKKVLAKLLGIAEDASDELITNTINGLKAPAITLSASQGTTAIDPRLVGLMSRGNEDRLNQLVNTGVISPAIKDKIAKEYVETQTLTLSLSKGGDNHHFDLLHDVLVENISTEVLLKEITGPQVKLELSNARQNQTVTPMQQAVNKRRVAAGLTN